MKQPPNSFPPIPQIPMADISWVKRKFLDIPYDTQSPNQRLDLYLPEQGKGPFPLMIHIHGGGFAFGDKRDDHMNVYLKGLHRGYAVASVEYRLSGEAIFPAAVLDCREALRFLIWHAPEFSIDPQRIAVIGGSAGGNLAALLGMNILNGCFPGEENRKIFSCQPIVQAAVDQFGPMAFGDMARQAQENGISKVPQDPSKMPEAAYIGVPITPEHQALLDEANPLTYASSSMAPMLVQHGTNDHLVPCAQSEEFVQGLHRKGLGSRVCYTPLEGADHEDKRFFQEENMDLVFRFLDTQLADLSKIQAIIFDLDGVLVHTDQYHYQAWQQLAKKLDIPFDHNINNRLRGVSRMESLEILLETYQGKPLSDTEKLALAEGKNVCYQKLLEQMTPESVSNEVRSLLADLRARGYRLAVGSSSKNARTILQRTELTDFFDAISDGNNISQSKPDPEVFCKAAEYLGVPCENCAVVEDAASGILAARRAGMFPIAYGSVTGADLSVRKIGFLTDLLTIFYKE